MPAAPNRLLASLSTDDFDLLAPHLEPVTLGLRKNLETVYFSEAGFASVVAVQSNGKEVEVGLIGREGMTGLLLYLAITARLMRPTFNRPEWASAYRRRNCAGRPRPASRFATRC
jgi:CRP-like cAMP-binding protein